MGLSYLDLTPERVLPRTKCPFYGFIKIDEIFVNRSIDSCAICGSSSGSCLFKAKNEIPDWENCPNNTENFTIKIELMKRDCVVLADEFIPDDISVEDNPPLVPFSFWHDYILETQWLDALIGLPNNS
ncbi:hypothetical protein HGB13_01685 [bacterium]|nr:hypothetical protein [bacterium]